MKEDNLTEEQEYKKNFFSNSPTFFSKKSRYIYPEVQDTTAILSSIASKPNFSQIRQRYKTKLFLSKILLKSHLNWILYSFCYQTTLNIVTQNHIGQSELEHQKLNILKYCKKSKDYNHIEKISISRDDKFYQYIKEENDKKQMNQKRDLFVERSYGIFENNITDKSQTKIINKIKEDIVKLNK